MNPAVTIHYDAVITRPSIILSLPIFVSSARLCRPCMYAAHSEVRPRTRVSVFVCEADLWIMMLSVSQSVEVLKMSVQVT